MRAFFLAATFGAALVVGCSSPESGSPAVQSGSGVSPVVGAKPQSRFVSATINRTFDGSGKMVNDKLTVTDPQELAALESYFPEAGTNQRGPQAGGWMPAVTFKLKPALGRTITVRSNYEVWSEGMGDWPVASGLKDHVERLFAHQTN